MHIAINAAKHVFWTCGDYHLQSKEWIKALFLKASSRYLRPVNAEVLSEKKRAHAARTVIPIFLPNARENSLKLMQPERRRVGVGKETGTVSIA